MATTIGGLTVDTLTGEVDELRTRYIDIGRERVDGTAVRASGRQADVSMITTTLLSTAATYAATKASYRALEGTLVTIVKSDGQTYPNVLVLRVNVGRETLINSTTALADILITARWSVRDTNI